MSLCKNSKIKGSRQFPSYFRIFLFWFSLSNSLNMEGICKTSNKKPDSPQKLDFRIVYNTRESSVCIYFSFQRQKWIWKRSMNLLGSGRSSHAQTNLMSKILSPGAGICLNLVIFIVRYAIGPSWAKFQQFVWLIRRSSCSVAIFVFLSVFDLSRAGLISSQRLRRRMVCFQRRLSPRRTIQIPRLDQYNSKSLEISGGEQI
jgi:hypothetical protein